MLFEKGLGPPHHQYFLIAAAAAVFIGLENFANKLDFDAFMLSISF